jgi:hypothetical protein
MWVEITPSESLRYPEHRCQATDHDARVTADLRRDSAVRWNRLLARAHNTSRYHRLLNPGFYLIGRHLTNARVGPSVVSSYAS